MKITPVQECLGGSDISCRPAVREHLHWPDLDVDLSLEILDAAESFPLICN